MGTSQTISEFLYRGGQILLYFGGGAVALFVFLIIVGLLLPSKLYVVEKDRVLFLSKNSERTILEGADPESFEHIKDSYWGKDKKKVFYGPWSVEGADGASFQLTENKEVGKDQKNVFLKTKIVPGADGSSFRFLTDPWGNISKYAVDKEHVYFITIATSPESIIVIEGADVKTFEVLIFKYIYPGMSTGSRRLEFAKDMNRVYYQEYEFSKAISKSFQILKTPEGEFSVFAEDEKTVFNLVDQKMLNVDRESFKVISEEKAEDRLNNYSAFFVSPRSK